MKSSRDFESVLHSGRIVDDTYNDPTVMYEWAVTRPIRFPKHCHAERSEASAVVLRYFRIGGDTPAISNLGEKSVFINLRTHSRWPSLVPRLA